MEVKEINYNELWQIVLSEMELMVSKANYATWFKNTSIINFEEGIIKVAVPNGFVKEWLENKFNKTILRAMRDYNENIRCVEYIIKNFPPEKNLKPYLGHFIEGAQLRFKEFQIDRKTNLNPGLIFKSFIVGSFNELAHAAALNVVEKPGICYNPLYIYGGVGLGKTHLIQATGNQIKKTVNNSKVLYQTSGNFTNEYVENVRAGTMHDFRKKYKSYDVLIIDDIQFIGGKEKTQEELFHIFNSFQTLNKQVVFSSDCPPKLIPNLEDRLRSRFEGGMMADISKPDFESRMAILKSKISNSNIKFTDEILEYICLNITENIRELEGAINLISAELKIKKELTSQQLKDILNKNRKIRKMVTPGQIIKKIANFYNINERSFFDKTRKKEIVRPRQIAMFILREDYNNSYPDIGRRFGGKDHTTAMYSYEKIFKELKTNPELINEINAIRNIILN